MVDGKAQGAHACLKKPLGQGSPAAKLPISGYQEARGQGFNVSRCHVIGNKLGGDGTREDNQFTCAQNPTNSANMYHQFEKDVAELASIDGVTVYYNVSLLYRDGASRPYAVAMSYTSNIGVSDHRTFANWAFKNGKWTTLG